jgi:hypothetical protein
MTQETFGSSIKTPESGMTQVELAREMIEWVRYKWPEVEAVRILDQFELDGGKPCDRCLLQILDYDTGEYVGLGFPLASMTRLVRMARGELGCDGPIRLAIAAYSQPLAETAVIAAVTKPSTT